MLFAGAEEDEADKKATAEKPFVVSGVAALVGKKNVSKVAQAPAQRVESVQADVAAAKGNVS